MKVTLVSRIVALLAVTVLAGGVLWIGGELHRQACIREGRSACSVLPWDQGRLPPAAHGVTSCGQLPESVCRALRR